MPRRREVSWDPAQIPKLHDQRHGARDRYKSPLAALMEAPPNAEPDETGDELLALREAIADAMEDALDERERYVFDSLFIERISLRRLANLLSLSKTQVARIRDEATRKLAAVLSDHPLVKGRLRADH